MSERPHTSASDSHGESQECGRDVSAREKIAEALRLRAKWSHVFERDERIATLIRQMGEAAAASARVMAQVGVSEICMRCDTEEGGSCCGAGIESRYSSTLLLVNLLLGTSLPTNRFVHNGCFFLGDRGCTLTARHVLCVNYLCARIQRVLSSEKLRHLQEATGREMDILFALHESLKKKMAD